MTTTSQEGVSPLSDAELEEVRKNVRGGIYRCEDVPRLLATLDALRTATGWGIEQSPRGGGLK